MISAVLLDLDDTLMDHQSAAARAVWHWAHELGLPGTPEELAQRWAMISNRHYAAYQRRELTVREQQQARVREFLPHLDLTGDTAAQAAFDAYAERYRAAWSSYPDARPVLERARAAGIRTGVLTNGEEPMQRAKLERGGLADLVDVFVASSTMPWSKPDPRAFHAACARLGSEPGRTLMVGDNLTVDVHGARAAGLPAVLVDRHGAHDQSPLHGAVRMTSLDGLFARS